MSRVGAARRSAHSLGRDGIMLRSLPPAGGIAVASRGGRWCHGAVTQRRPLAAPPCGSERVPRGLRRRSCGGRWVSLVGCSPHHSERPARRRAGGIAWRHTTAVAREVVAAGGLRRVVPSAHHVAMQASRPNCTLERTRREASRACHASGRRAAQLTRWASSRCSVRFVGFE